MGFQWMSLCVNSHVESNHGIILHIQASIVILKLVTCHVNKHKCTSGIYLVVCLSLDTILDSQELTPQLEGNGNMELWNR